MNIDLTQIIVALIVATPGTIAAYVSLRNGRKIDEVHRSTNGKMDQLVDEVRTASLAKGRKDEKDEEEERKRQ